MPRAEKYSESAWKVLYAVQVRAQQMRRQLHAVALRGSNSTCMHHNYDVVTAHWQEKHGCSPLPTAYNLIILRMRRGLWPAEHYCSLNCVTLTIRLSVGTILVATSAKSIFQRRVFANLLRKSQKTRTWHHAAIFECPERCHCSPYTIP